MAQDKKVESNPKKAKTEKSIRGGGIGVKLAMVLALASIVISAFGLYEIKQSPLHAIQQSFHTQVAKDKDQQSQIIQLQGALEKANTQIALFSNQSEQVRSAFNSALGSYQGQLDALTQRISSVQNSYLLPEKVLSQQIDAVNINAAMLYLDLATQYISITSNFDAAKSLVQRAESALISLDGKGRAALYQIGKAQRIINDQSTLNNAQTLEKLTTLISEVTQLELAKPGNANKSSTTSTVNAADPQKENSMADALLAGWDRLKSLLVIEDFGDVDKILIEKRARAAIQYALRAHLQQAQIAALQNYGKLFEENLEEARQLVSTYFAPTATTRAWLQVADQLKMTNPDASLNALNSALKSIAAIAKPAGVAKGAK